jgi:superfamily II DNA/RNA helicase
VTTFADLGLSEDILKAIQDVGYTTPTPIQEQAIPYVLQGRDVLGMRPDGHGQDSRLRAADALSAAGTRAAPSARMPRTLILEPTRELAAQVEEAFEASTARTITSLNGGASDRRRLGSVEQETSRSTAARTF